MAGTDENVAMIGDWTPPNPSPRTYISNFINEEYGSRSFSDFLTENGNEGPLPGSEKQKLVLGPKVEEGETGAQNPNNLSFDPNLFGAHKSSSQGGLAERMAARAGFNLPKLNMARITSADMASSPSEVRSPYLTIPPGLSPTTLLESPVFLSNAMAQPSPTTGKFTYGQNNHSIPISIVSAAPDKSEHHSLPDVVAEAFAFKPHLEPNSSFYPNAEKKIVSAFGQQQQLPSIEVSVQSENPGQTLSQEAGTTKFQNQQEISLQGGFSDSSDRKDAPDDIFNQKMSDSFAGNEHSPPPDDHQDGEGEQKGELSSVTLGTPAEDGYNWRKYGQKQVKGSEFPRSYYKCTHPNCQVKKKVERSHEGHITEIIYKGAHSHPKPPPNRRSGVPSSQPFNDAQTYGSEHPASQATFDGKPLWPSGQNGAGSHDWRADGLEATSSATAAADFCDPSASVQTQDGPRLETSDAIDVSSTLSNEEEEDDRATHGSVSLGGDGEGDETESKRRKLDACTIEMSAASRAVREPRVVVQTTSEVDILDDGYRWRKYGQKVVKGNPNPRSYYKCTNPGCTVRKHVERASHDLKSVITTYEGKHNHDVPAARNNNHANSAPSSTAAMAAPQPHGLLRRPEPTQDGLVRFDGPSPLGAFGLPGREQLGPPPAAFSFGMSQQGLANLAMAGLGPMASMKMPALPPVHPYLAHRQASDGGFMIPKGEPKEEPMSESRLPMPNGGSVYHQMMSRLPLGPQL